MRWLVCILLAGCSSGICDRGPVCKAEPPPSPQSVQACKDQEKTLSGQACLAERDRFVSCQFDNTKCTADGHIDDTASAQARTANCGTPMATFQACCTQNPMSMVCKL